ncbi:hypothetical protein [Hymenobacter koreensis]|uniref:M50 family peptidase n=1 Tax=Hymenobacter koreensis TaxID=1084523 RepID=A0ABP8JJI4_9BACT
MTSAFIPNAFPMKLHLTFRYVVAFLLLNLLVSELHELAHLAIGGLVCGCYGPRDFNAWHSCTACANPEMINLSAAAGPLWSYAMMWVGVLGLRSGNATRQALGFSVLFAALPFARIITVLMGGGDELVIVRRLVPDGASVQLYKWLMTGLVLVLAGTPLVLAYRRVRNARPGLWIAGFAVGPLLFQALYLFQLMNGLLHRGVLADSWLLGTHVLIWLHTAVVATLLLYFRRFLLHLTAPAKEPVLVTA